VIAPVGARNHQFRPALLEESHATEQRAIQLRPQ